MVNGAIHRVIEQQAAMQPDAIAIRDGSHAVSYRELNGRANTLARRLGESGLRRGAVALVRMERGVDLAAVLLAVLKAGAAYTWIEPGTRSDTDLPGSFCIVKGKSSSEQGYLAIDIYNALAACLARPSPNLPILTRGTDTACILCNEQGEPSVLVRHETITSMPARPAAGAWTSDAGAFHLWIGLMSGETLILGDDAQVPAATQAA